MKKLLLCLTLVSASMISMSQVMLSELYVRPNDPNSEFFELYNPVGGTATNLDCYTLITYYDDGTRRGFYVLDLPNTILYPGQFYVGSSQTVFTYQDAPPPATAQYNWNMQPTATSSALFYSYNGTGYTPEPLPAGYNDVFLKSGSGGGVYATFLYNGSTLVDAFLGASSKNTLPSYITELPNLVANNLGCGTVTANFGALANTPINFVQAAAGTDNGYYVCGEWQKSSSPTEHTPGRPNGAGARTSISVQATCLDGNVSFTIMGGANGDFPIVATVYADAGIIGVFEPGTDPVRGSVTVNTKNAGMQNLTITPSELLILVLDGPGACNDMIVFFQCEEGIVTPITLKSFNARRNNSNVALSWETATEQNNKGFFIQRKRGNGSWETVDFVPSQALGGNSTSLLSYTYADVNSERGTTQYRLHQVDIDGRNKFTDIRSVRGMGQSTNVIVYPNPSKDGTVNIVFDDANGSRSVFISDMSGRIVKQWKTITSSSMRVERMQPGMYHIRIRNDQSGQQTTEKLVVSQ